MFIFILLVTPLCATQPKDIIYMTEDYPPENYLEQGVLKGYAVEILKAIWKRMEVPEMPIHVVPWSRGYKLVQDEPNHMLFAMARTPERENLFKWVGPIYHADMILFSLKNKNFKINNINDAKKYRIGVLRKDIGESILKDAGFSGDSLSSVNTVSQLIQMLETGHIEMIFTTEASIKRVLFKNKSLNLKYKPVFLVEEMNVFYAFNRSTDDAVITTFQKALKSINKERKSIIKKYKLPES
jgi:polar amino acid transport system substrate-binding protein